MPDLQTAIRLAAARKEIRDLVEERERLYAELETNRGRLAELLKKGKRAGLGVIEMAALAKLNRERVSELIHDRAPSVRRGRPRKETP